MANQKLITLIPAIEPDELAFLQELTKELTDEKLNFFISIYNGKRKKSETILICALLGFFGVAGVHRFLIGQLGMGILYFFTAGLCLVGTIVDIINHKQLAYEFNQKMAVDALVMVKSL